MQQHFKFLGKQINLTLRNDGDFYVANELFLDHRYRFCDEVIKNAKNCIIDIGGHLGFFSIMTSLLNSDVPIYAFEPHIDNYDLLKQNLKNNRIKNVYSKNLAVSDSIGQMELQISKEDLNHSLTKAIEPTGETQIIQTTTLDRIFTKNRIVKCDLLKLDCEGSEFKIIYSADKSIFKKITSIFIEYHNWADEVRRTPSESADSCGGTGDELKNYLQKMGYKVQKYPNHKKPELGFLWCCNKFLHPISP